MSNVNDGSRCISSYDSLILPLVAEVVLLLLLLVEALIVSVEWRAKSRTRSLLLLLCCERSLLHDGWKVMAAGVGAQTRSGHK